MKKITSIIVIIILLFVISSCSLLKNKYIVMGNGVDITIPNEYKQYMLLPNNLPSIHFDLDNVRISTDSTNAIVKFVQNDQYILSDAMATHLSRYTSDEIIETRCVEREEKNGAKLGKDYLPIDEGTKSLEKIIIATNTDGTRYSYSFRTFQSNGKIYYAYTYIENMSIALEMPLMAVIHNNERKLVLLPLPYDTKYIVGGFNIELESLLTKDQYLDTTDENYFTFNYPNYLKNKNSQLDYLESSVKDWYAKYCNGHLENDKFVIEYIGAKFWIDFNQEKLNNDTGKKEAAFRIRYIGKK